MPKRPSTGRAENPPPEECANCGEEIPRDAKSCPGCGADERTGWRETSIYDDLDLPEEAWTDGDSPPAPRARKRRVNGIAWYWWCVAAVVLLLFGLGVLGVW